MLAQRAGLGAGLRLTLIVITGSREEAMTEAELAIVRRAYAKQVMLPYNAGHPRVRQRSLRCAARPSSGRGRGQ